MSGPLRTEDADLEPRADAPATPELEITPAREARVGSHRVRRALPRRSRRTVGAWCFLDHMGPATVTEPDGVGIGTHPHIGLQTVTWLLAGELLHRDTLGSEQPIRPGQLNLMTAGHGVAHAEEATPYRGTFQGVQLWVAQPEATRHDAPAFEHHAAIPRVELPRGIATVLVGELAGTHSPARRDTDHIGVDLDLWAGVSTIPLRPDHEHAVVVLDGTVTVAGETVAPGSLAYLGLGRDELDLEASDPVRALLVGGAPFESPVVMWSNFVGRTRDEMVAATDGWNTGADRFGEVDSRLDRIPAPSPPWTA